MILLLFPTMTLQASILVWTTIFVVVNELSRTPICTLVLLVNVKLGFSSKILPVVSKDTLVPLMVVFVIRTPDSLEVKHVEVRVLIKFIDEFNWYLWFTMCKRTIVTILAFPCSIDIGCTKLCLVLIRMIELFHSVVSFLAFVAFRAISSSGNMMTHFWLITAKGSSLILFLIVIVWTPFKVVAVWINLARCYFEKCQIKKSAKWLNLCWRSQFPATSWLLLLLVMSTWRWILTISIRLLGIRWFVIHHWGFASHFMTSSLIDMSCITLSAVLALLRRWRALSCL